jgi:hypothetical protein
MIDGFFPDFTSDASPGFYHLLDEGQIASAFYPFVLITHTSLLYGFG